MICLWDFTGEKRLDHFQMNKYKAKDTGIKGNRNEIVTIILGKLKKIISCVYKKNYTLKVT